MSRTTGSSGPKTMEAIHEAGLRLIYERGYEAMTLRGLAAQVGIHQGSLYNYFRTKQELLFTLVSRHMHDLIAACDHALAGKNEPLERLHAFITFHIDYHMTRKHAVFVNYSELRSFEDDNYQAIIAMRRQYEQRLIEIIDKLHEAGLIIGHDPKIMGFGLLSMLTGICHWFSPEGRLPREEIIATYTDMALGALGLGKGERGA